MPLYLAAKNDDGYRAMRLHDDYDFGISACDH